MTWRWPWPRKSVVLKPLNARELTAEMARVQVLAEVGALYGKRTQCVAANGEAGWSIDLSGQAEVLCVLRIVSAYVQYQAALDDG